MKPLCYGYVFARGGSRGVPRKNIRPLGGKPLIAYAVEALKGSGYIDRVIVSTEDEEIARIARDSGGEVPFMRPAELARDESPELEAWRHALDQAREEGRMPDIFVSAPATSPFRDSEDIDRAARLFLEGDADLVIGVTPSAHNPYFNMVSLGADGSAEIVLCPSHPVVRRQDAPAVYNITTVVYVARPAYIRGCSSLLEGCVRGVEIPAERALDIDTVLDFDYAEFLMARRNGER